MLHKYVAPAFPASNVIEPGQGVASEPKATTGTGLTVTATVFDVAEQPFPSTTFTE